MIYSRSLSKLTLALSALAGSVFYAPCSFSADGDIVFAKLEAQRQHQPAQEHAPYLRESPIGLEQYRVRAAQHIYKLNTDKVYAGRMPPLLKAIGVVEVQLASNGEIRNLKWNRAPLHAPEVMREIERTLLAAAPYPTTLQGESMVFTETWLWHKSGRFQLLSLTEGQD